MECLRCDKEVSPGKALCPACLLKQPNLQADTKVIQSSILNHKKNKERVLELDHAGFWLRSIAFMIDMAILLTIQNLLLKALYAKCDKEIFKYLVTKYSIINPALIHPSTVVGTLCFALLPTIIYYCLFESSRLQGSIGKSILGLRVSDLSGVRLSFFKSLYRSIARTLSLVPFISTALFYITAKNINLDNAPLNLLLSLIPVPLSYLLAALTSQKQSFHDKLAGTLVNKGPASGRKRIIFGLVLLMWILIAGFFIAYQNPEAQRAVKEALLIFDTSVLSHLKSWLRKS